MSHHLRWPVMLLTIITTALAHMPAHSQQASQTPTAPAERSANAEVEEDAPQLQVFHLKYLKAETAAKVIQTLLSREKVRVATDPRTNAVIVEGSATHSRAVEALLKEMDRNEPDFDIAVSTEPKVENLTLRLVWLLEGAPETGLPAPLSDAFEELQRLGVPGLGVAGQLLIKTTSENQFSLSSELEVDSLGAPCLLTLEGYVESPQRLRLSIDVRQKGDGPEQQPAPSLMRIETSLAIQPGKAIVLGANPTGKHTSAFIVLVEKP